MKLTDVDFSFQKKIIGCLKIPRSLFESFWLFLRNKQLFLYLDCTRKTVVDCRFLVFEAAIENCLKLVNY